MRDANSVGAAGGFVRTADSVDLFTRDWGEGAPIVFLASWSLPSDSWCYQMTVLSEQGLRCVAYDRRGHGRSADPGRGYDFDTLADDLSAVLEALDLRGVMLVSHSMSAGEIVRYLTRHGRARVSRVAMLGTITPSLRRSESNPAGVPPEHFETFRRTQLMRDFPQWIEDNLPPFVTPKTPAAMRDWVRNMALSASMKALVDCNRAIQGADFSRELCELDVPTLLIHGTHDVTCPLELTAGRTVALMPRARLSVCEGAPHGLFLTHMERVNAELLAFARG